MTGEQGKRKKGKGIHTKGRRTRWTEFHKACKPPPRANIKFNLPEIFSFSLSCFHEINKIRARDSNRVVSAKDRRTVTRGELNGWTENTVGLLPPREPPREFYARHGMDRDLISAFRWRRYSEGTAVVQTTPSALRFIIIRATIFRLRIQKSRGLIAIFL